MAPTATTNGHQADQQEIDCLVVGGGFAGVQLLYTMRKQGFNTKLFEAMPGFGGIWRNACYPGARVDSELPIYGLKFPEVYRSWSWSQRYPDYKEIRQYFDHVDKVLELSKDCQFNTRVHSAFWNENNSRWDIIAGDQKNPIKISAKYFFLCIGFAAKINWPDIPNRDRYKGKLYHSGFWPEGLEPEQLRGKSIGIVGTGASGVQITQALGKVAKDMTVFVRTPNLTLPMENPKMTKETQDLFRDGWDAIYEKRNKTFAGFHYDFDYNDWSRHTPEQREAFYEDIWSKKGFHFWLETYVDVYFKKDCNDTAYAFWHKKTAPMVKDEKKRGILVPPPDKAHHTFGTVRPSLQVDYYDILNQDNVDVISVKENPIKTFTETGVELNDGKKVDFEVMALATGYDTHTGGFLQIDIRGKNGKPLTEHWKEGCKSQLGLATSGFPNMFFAYGPHGPTAYSNGPSTTDIQCEFLARLLNWSKENNIKSIEAKPEAEQAFVKRIDDLSKATLFHQSHGWYMGRNVKGKPVQALNYTGGIPTYIKDLEESEAAGYSGFEAVKA